MKSILSRIILLASLSLTGCTAILNPFESEFACPDLPKGKCISIKGAYNEDLASSSDGSFSPDETLPATDKNKTRQAAVSESSTGREAAVDKPCCSGKPDTNIEKPAIATPVSPLKSEIPLQEYRDASLKKVTKLLRDPVTPVIAPPQVMRVLILPYEDDDGALNLQRFKFIMVDRAKWVLGDYLSNETDSGE